MNISDGSTHHTKQTHVEEEDRDSLEGGESLQLWTVWKYLSDFNAPGVVLVIAILQNMRHSGVVWRQQDRLQDSARVAATRGQSFTEDIVEKLAEKQLVTIYSL